MKANTAMIFRDMVSYLYSVLDHIFYFLYCHSQNNGRESFTKDAFNIKQPISFKLKYSPNPGEDPKHPECIFKKNRNDWVEEQCRKIFGDQYYENDNLKSRLGDIRDFQKNLLSIQAIKEIDKAGKELPSANGGVKLLMACKIQQETQEGPFSPTSIDFQELPSVETNWNDAMTFNVLHFFRNFTTHRTLVECYPIDWYLNQDTMVFTPCENGQNLDYISGSTQLIKISTGLWIEVPELSHLRQEKRDAPITFYKLPILHVCGRLLSFVREQRDNLLIICDQKAFDVGDLSWGWDENDEPRIKINGQIKEWYNARFET